MSSDSAHDGVDDDADPREPTHETGEAAESGADEVTQSHPDADLSDAAGSPADSTAEEAASHQVASHDTEPYDTEPYDTAIDRSADPDATDSDTGGVRQSQDVWPKRFVLGASALTLAAFIVAAVFGVLWLVTATGDRAEVAEARSAVSDAARQGVHAFTELDHKNPDQLFERAKKVSTQQFAQAFLQDEDRIREALSQVQTTVTTTVRDVAVQQLNNRDGTATFIAVAETKVSQGGQESTKVMRLKGQLKRVSGDDGEQWKVDGFGRAPVVGNQGSGSQSNGQESTGTSSPPSSSAGQSNGGS